MITLLALVALGADPSPDPHAEVRGVTVSCQTWGWEWGTDDMARTLDTLVGLGVNWIAFHPYAGIAADGTVSWDTKEPRPEWITRPIEMAHARGMKVMVVPHLAHWGSGFSWRGDIRFSDEASVARFFSTYDAWIVQVAAASAGADAFVVGSELDQTVKHEAEWRRTITAVRSAFPGLLTYGANWDRFEQVPFWDALDAIGVQAYFPVGSAGETSVDALRAGWSGPMEQVRAVAARTGKPVVFTELGYDDGLAASSRPWENGRDGAEGEAVQRACLRAALAEIAEDPVVRGAFLWKWFPGDAPSSDFGLARDDLRAVVREAWGAPTPTPAAR